jgi:hypothetical protein
MCTGKRFPQWTAVAFMAALPGLAVAQTPQVALSSESVTKQVWNGSCDPDFGPGPKTVYTPANWFLPTDSSATVYFEVDNIASTDQFTNKWKQPDGTVFSTGAWPSASGNECFSAQLNIAGTSVASMSGMWHAQVFLNASLLFDLPFTIGATSPGTPIVDQAMTTPYPPSSCHPALTTEVPVTTFPTTDQSIGLWFSVAGASAGDFPLASWSAPDGTLYDFAWNRLASSGSACFGATLNGEVSLSGGTPVVLSPGNWSVTVYWNNNLNTPLFTLGFTIAAASEPPPTANTPTINFRGITNAAGPANGQAPVAPGSLISIYGTNLSTQQTGQSASAFPLPTLMAGSQVMMNGIYAPLVYVSAGQINAQVPWEVAGATSLSVQVISNGMGSSVATTALADTAPGIFAIAHAANGSTR